MGSSDPKFRCYQSADSTQVVYAVDPSGPKDELAAVVMISRVVGHDRARGLMRLCNAILNNEVADAEKEFEALVDDMIANLEPELED